MKKRNTKPTLLLAADGKKRHPLVVLAESMSTRDIGKLLGHGNHSTASIYISRARKTPTLAVPSGWVLPLARALRVTPASLRPDLYLPEWTVDVSNQPA
jgi:hypothetical protein